MIISQSLTPMIVNERTTWKRRPMQIGMLGKRNDSACLKLLI
jgi:hypothetical protein